MNNEADTVFQSGEWHVGRLLKILLLRTITHELCRAP